MNFRNYNLLISIICISTSSISQNYEWGGRFGGTGEDVILSMDVSDNGNVVTAGYYTDTADFDISEETYDLTSNGNYDTFISKTNSQGNLLWAKSIGGTGFDYPRSVTTDNDGNIYISGSFEDTVDFNPGPDENFLTSIGGNDIYILKLNPNGDFIWARSVGGLEYEDTYGIQVDELGTVYILGYLYETAVDFDPGPAEVILTSVGSSDTFLLLLDSNGDFTSVYQYGGQDSDLALDFKVKNQNEIFITGQFKGTTDLDPNPINTYNVTSAPNNFSTYALKLDGSGNLVSAYVTEGGDVSVRGIDVDDDNNIYLGGFFSGTVNFNPESGNNDFQFTSDIAFNGYVLKIRSDGTFDWARRFESNDPFFIFDLKVSENGDVYSSGYFNGTADFNPSTTVDFTLSKVSQNASDAFLSVLDNTGVFKNAYQYGGASFKDTHCMGFDTDNNLYLSGHFEDTVDLNPDGDEVSNVTALDFRDNYIIKLAPASLGVVDVKKQLRFYPNPVRDLIYFDSTLNLEGKAYIIYNTLGAKVLEGYISSGNSIKMNTLKSGVYLINIDSSYGMKIIKE